MNSSKATLDRRLEKYLAKQMILFRGSESDRSHFIVYFQWPDGIKEEIGHLYMQEGDTEAIYYSMNKNGEELIPPTADFNEVEVQFDAYAKLLMTEKALKKINNNSLQNNLTLNKLNQMKNSNQNPTNSKKVNQIIFVEYQHPTQEGHIITVTDSYRNTIGKILRSYNQESKKYEYVALDHSGKQMMEKNEKLWEIKSMYTGFSKELLEEAHQRRIASKDESRSTSGEKSQSPDSKMEEQREINSNKSKSDKSPNEKPTEYKGRDREEKNEVTWEETEQAIRENELEQLREREEGREDRSVER